MIVLQKQQNQYQWLQYDQAGNLLTEKQLAYLHEAPEIAGNEKVIMLFPGQNVLTRTVNLPKTKKSELTKALAYSLEDQLITDVTELEFLIGDTNATGVTNIAVMDKQQLCDELALLKKFGIKPARLIPDYLSLPLHPHAWTVFVSGELAWVRTGIQTGFVVDTDNLFQILELAITQNPPNKLFVITDRRVDLGYLKMLNVNMVWQVQTPKTWVWQTLTENDHFNILQGANKPKANVKKVRNYWLSVVVLAILLAAVVLGGKILQLTQLKHQSNALRQKIAGVYHEVYPERVDVSEPRFNMQHYIEKLRKIQQKEQFFPLLARAAAVLKADPTIDIRAMNYARQILTIKVRTKKLANLERLPKRLSEQALNVQQQHVLTNKQFVSANVLVRSK